MKTGAIFDMDGILFDTERIYKEIWYGLADELGVDLGDRYATELSGTGGDDMPGIVERLYHVDDGAALIRVALQRMEDRVREQVPVLPGVPEILKYLKNAGMKIAIASGSRAEQIRHNIEVAGLSDYVDTVASGLDFERGKPAPDVFLHSAEKLGLSPEDCYVFEDSYNGVKAGHAAGCEVIMVPNLAPVTEEIRPYCDHICGDMFEALELVREEV